MMRLAILVLVASCGGNRAQIEAEREPFNCKARSATYQAAKHISGDELGVLLDCEAAGPRVKRWKTSRDGKHVEDTRAITPGEFDHAWKEIEGTGWPNLHDCANGSLEKGDPLYSFEIKDDENSAKFECQTRVMPYPYNDITDPLDMLANKGKQLGDDEPADAKALDKKDRQR
jgi:hypothetical protein